MGLHFKAWSDNKLLNMLNILLQLLFDEELKTEILY